MRIFRKIIYIGESNGKAIYIDTDNPTVALEAPKSPLLSTDKARNNGTYIAITLFVISTISGIMKFFPATRFLAGKYSLGTLVYFVLFWIFECVLLLILTEKALYKNVKQLHPTSKENFRNAVNSNLIWNNFTNKKITLTKKIIVWIFTIFIGGLGIVSPILVIYILFSNMIGKPIGSEIFMLSFLGILIGGSGVSIWQNNFIRWFNTVENYRKKK